MSVRHVFRHMPFDPVQLHELAWDVGEYPKFINFISAIRVLRSNESSMRAEVRVRYKMIAETFITDIERNADNNQIFVKLVKGPLRKLENHWRFHRLSDGSTLVEFWVSFGFSIPWLGSVFGSKQAKAEQMIMRAFEDRAGQAFSPVSNDYQISEAVQQEILDLQALQQQR